MQAVQRIEIVLDALETDRVLSLLQEAGVAGYSVIRQVEGMGERGMRKADDLTGALQNSYILIACAPNQVTLIVEAVRPILRAFGGLCLVSDAQSVIH